MGRLPDLWLFISWGDNVKNQCHVSGKRASRKEKKITTFQIKKNQKSKNQTWFCDFSGSAANFLQAYDAPQFVTERERERAIIDDGLSIPGSLRS
jgi:hypothetical protein